MKRSTVLSILVLISMVLVAVPAPMAAQEPAATPARAVDESPKPAAAPAAPIPGAPRIGTWELGPATPFQWTRFDAAFVPGPDGQAWANKVYFLGGRTGTAPAHDLNIWSFDPVAGTYADTGHDMLVNISNYVANVILDDGTGNGPAIYIIGGYNADAAANHGDVQRYYPQTGVVELLPDCDDWTIQVAGYTVGAMGQAVVDDVIYVFGGWQSTAAPYFNGSTWAFDPNAASCSRWTDLGTNLTPPRAYIQTAAQDGKVYAMGGIDVYTGSELDPTAVVEVLDTANLGAGWQAVASMPVAGAEGRGFGFDADTLGSKQPAGRIYVAGTADWSAGSAEAMEYQVGLDFWEQAFPDLNEDRRDHAGAYVPIETGTEGDGLPGMWVFGGRWDNGDAPPFAPTEFYEFPVLECDILVVDDDWDFDQTVPNDGGRPYYTSTLDFLGYGYDLWDTIGMGTPTSTDMEPYEVVIWFTGYDWVDPISPTTEGPELMTYMDNGGNLLMSSQEQQYAYPGSTIMSDYFWVASVTEDVVLTGTVGSPGDPLFSGLGPYDMGRPDAWAAYWPTAGFQGPYDDEVYVKVGGLEPMVYTDSSNPNSTRFEGAGFKTIYLGYPFEWVTDVADRAEFMETALNWFCAAGGGAFELIPPGQTGGGIAGSTVPYTMTIFNDLGYAETFSMTYDSIWPIAGPPVVGPVADGATQDFIVEVTVPNDGMCYDSELAMLLAETQSAIYLTDTAVIETSVLPSGLGIVDGYVYDANTSLGIENAYVYLELGDEEYETHADADGYYSIMNVPGCTYEGQYQAVGYFGQFQVPVAVTGGMTTTLDIWLDASMPALSENAVSVDVAVDSTDTYNLNLANNGTGDLTFHITEVSIDSIYPIPVPVQRAAMPSGIDPQVYADLACFGRRHWQVHRLHGRTGGPLGGLCHQGLVGARPVRAERAAGHRRAQPGCPAGRPGSSRHGLRVALHRQRPGGRRQRGPGREPRHPARSGLHRRQRRDRGARTGGHEACRRQRRRPSSGTSTRSGPTTCGAPLGRPAQGIVVANIDTGVDYDHPALVQPVPGQPGRRL